jgi:hypothetical protein
MPQRGGGIDSSLNEALWFFAPTGRKGIAQGKAKRRPGFRDVINIASPERAEPAVRKSCDDISPFQGFGELGWRTTQGGAALYPGLSHYAPLGRTIPLRIGVDPQFGENFARDA